MGICSLLNITVHFRVYVEQYQSYALPILGLISFLDLYQFTQRLTFECLVSSREPFCADLENREARMLAAFGPAASAPPFLNIIKAPRKDHHKGMCFTSQHRWLVYSIFPFSARFQGWIQILLLAAVCGFYFYSRRNPVVPLKDGKKPVCFSSFSYVKRHRVRGDQGDRGLLPAVP